VFHKTSFVSRYLKGVAEKRSVLCVGLDPTPTHVPPNFGTGLPAMRDYLMAVVETAAEKVPVVKPQYAYYAALGQDYVQMMTELVRYAHELDLLVILDAKRADIGETMEQYGTEVFGRYGVDACTFVPYLGPTFLDSKASKSWVPWLEQGRCAITMIRTSNPEAALIQDLKLESGLLVYEKVALSAKDWHEGVNQMTEGKGCVGGVVGATWPEQAPRCRELAGDGVFFLIPSYGPGQGGGAEGAVGGLPNSLGWLMGTVNNSRGTTLYSWWDRECKEPRAGDPMALVAASIDAANVDLNLAIERKLGVTIAEAAAKGVQDLAAG